MLDAGLAIRGTLTDDGTNPLPGWRVLADAPEGVPLPDSVKTAADGRFALVGCAPSPYTIRCYADNEKWHEPILERRGVEPGGEPLELRVSQQAMPSCTVAGRLAADQPGGEILVLMVAEGSNVEMAGPLQPGESFRMSPVPRGPYSFQNQRRTEPGTFTMPPLARLGACELQPGQCHDLGEVRLPEPGELAVELVDGAGVPVAKASLTFALIGAPMRATGVTVRDGRGSAQVAPGTYLPTMCSDGMHVEHAPITVQSGERTAVRLQLAGAVHRRVRYDLTAVGVPMRAFATWNKAGTPLQRHWFDFWQEHPSTIDHHFTPGSWELELELDLVNGSVQRFPFVVTGEIEAPAIEIRVTR